MKKIILLFPLLFVLFANLALADIFGSATTDGTYLSQFQRGGHNITITASQVEAQEFNISGTGTYYLDSITFVPVVNPAGSFVNIRLTLYADSADTPAEPVLIYNESSHTPLIYTNCNGSSQVVYNFSSYPLTYGSHYWATFTSSNASGSPNPDICAGTNANLSENAEAKAEGSLVWVEETKKVAMIITYHNATSIIIPNISLIIQNPSNITATTLLNQIVNITYSYSNSSFENHNLAYNFTRTSGDNCWQFLNGSCLLEVQNQVNLSPAIWINGTNQQNVSFSLTENLVYPTTSNLNSSFFSQAHSALSFTNQNEFVQITLLNMTINATTYNIFEIMANTTGTARAYICNDTYSTGAVISSLNCVEVATINSTGYNHSHGANSGHNLIPFIISGGKVNGILQATKNLTFLIRGQNGAVVQVWYVANDSRTGATKTTNNGGATWTIQTYSPDAHLHQYTGSETLNYKATGNISSLFFNSSTSSELIDLTEIAPTPPIITSPFNTNQSTKILNISWIQSLPSNLVAKIQNYTLQLLNSDMSFNRTIAILPNSSSSYYWNLYDNNVSAGFYYVRIFANDSLGGVSFDEESFNLSTETEFVFFAKDAYTNATISTFNFNITREDGSFFSNSSTNGSYVFNTLRNKTHNISIDALGYALFLSNFTSASNASSGTTFLIYKTNSVYITILNEETLVLITGTLVNVSFIGISTYNFNTTNGTLFVSNLTPDYYEVMFEANGYSPKSYFLTITNRTTQTLNALLTASFSGIGVYAKNAGDEPLSGSLITIQRFINGSYITIAQGQTDGVGYNLFQLENGINYLWTITAQGYLVKQFFLKPYSANQPYIFKLESNVSAESISFNDFVGYRFSPSNQTLLNGSTDFTFTTLSKNNSFGSNSILWTSMNCNGSTTNVSGSPSGTTILQTRDLTNNVGLRITCYYGLQVDGYPAFYFQNNYVVLGYSVGNDSLIKASEDVREETPEAWQGIVAMFLIAIVVLIVYEFSKESRDLNLVVSVAGFGVLICLAFLQWVSITMTAIIVIEAGLLYYANRGGY